MCTNYYYYYYYHEWINVMLDRWMWKCKTNHLGRKLMWDHGFIFRATRCDNKSCTYILFIIYIYGFFVIYELFKLKLKFSRCCIKAPGWQCFHHRHHQHHHHHHHNHHHHQKKKKKKKKKKEEEEYDEGFQLQLLLLPLLQSRIARQHFIGCCCILV